MTPLHQRWLMFLTGCLGSRLAFAYWAKTSSITILQILGAVALLPAIGFWYLYLTGKRKTGPEVLGEPIWWNALRPIHGTLYAVFAVLALFGYQHAWIVLFVDVLFGASAFAYHHWLPHFEIRD
jgi:hypothetical protein